MFGVDLGARRLGRLAPSELIVGRALMGVGAALIFPATLAILTNVFRDPSERAKAIGIWSAVSGIAVAAGPITGGWLLEHFWWGSVFFVNVPDRDRRRSSPPWSLVPESKDAARPALDPVGPGPLDRRRSRTLVFTIIEAPEWGWLSRTTLAGFAVAAALLGAFVRWELRVDAPDAAGPRSSATSASRRRACRSRRRSSPCSASSS